MMHTSNIQDTQLYCNRQLVVLGGQCVSVIRYYINTNIVVHMLHRRRCQRYRIERRL